MEDQRTEIAQLKSNLELLQAERDDLLQRNMKLEENVEVLEKDKELDLLRTVQEERRRWETREERLLHYVEGVEKTM